MHLHSIDPQWQPFVRQQWPLIEDILTTIISRNIAIAPHPSRVFEPFMKSANASRVVIEKEPGDIPRHIVGHWFCFPWTWTRGHALLWEELSRELVDYLSPHAVFYTDLDIDIPNKKELKYLNAC